MSLPSEEQWRTVRGYGDGRYEVSDRGRVRSYARPGDPIILKPGHTSDGYPVVFLASPSQARKTFRIHRLVMLAFGPAPQPGEEVRHLNGNPADNRRENLAWGTHAENMADRVRHGTDRNAQKTHCPRGHALDALASRSNGRLYRRCSICREASQRRSNAKRDYSVAARPRGACPHCGTEMRADDIKRHVGRMHGRAAPS